MVCSLCLIQSTDSYFSNWCPQCHKLQRIIHLFTIDKVMSVLENVLIVDEETQEHKIKEELKSILTTREYNLRKKKEKKSTPLPPLSD
jgi:glutaredoxin